MSKGDFLRGFVTQRLAAASEEILAAVDRIVAGYEEEASGFRQEIDRQRRRLEVLQAQVSLTKAGVKRRTVGHVDEEEDDEDEENLKNLEDSTDQRCHRKRRRPGTQIRDSQDHVDLRIRILEDSQTDVLSRSALKKCPLLRLRCPLGLQGTDFLDLLRSSFPQLSNRRFDVLTSDRKRRLRPLRATPLTAEEIHGSVGGANRKSMLYIRLKTLKVGEEDVGPLQTNSGDRDEGRPQISSQQQDVEAEDHGIPTERKDDGKEEANESEGDWKPDRSDEELKEEEKVRRSAVETEESEAEDDVFSCRLCRALHQSEEALVKHAWSHLDDPGSFCGACGELSESAEALKDHLQSCHQTDDRHDDERQHEEKPNKVFALKGELRAHCRTQVGKKTHLCGVCGKSLSDYRSLSRHKMTHSGERPHSCHVCGRRFKLSGTLRQHEKIHTDRERSYLCDVCCKMFLTSKQLQIHMRTHTNEKPYHCGECGKGFTTKGPLTVHMRVHTGETPYCCPDCGWAFKRKINLDNHVTVHSGLKPFVCGICGKACARKTYLTVHMRTHNGERPYKCSVCDKAFTQSHCLKSHLKSHQGEEQTST